ncbi:MAG: zinc ribbon domain-containing protein [Desulfobulbaceae bacterium]|nr:zinc ribbon domain-containing protein [Desulfobulbaceae bacterium]HIJ78206.1 zinc ribbon domain-containing protein [Deltaproteobacteria bacterium]
MPIYEFRCQECKNPFEALVTSSAAISEVSCPKCNSKNIKKTISAASFKISSGNSSIPAGALSGCSSKSGFS